MESVEQNQNTSEIKKTIEEIDAIPVPPVRTDEQVNEIQQQIQQRQEVITETTTRVDTLRGELGLASTTVDIPSLENTKKEVSKLEQKLQEILQSDVSLKYAETIEKVRQSKIDWAHSTELARRLKLKGATDEDVEQVKNWLVDNALNAKTIILPVNKFRELADVLSEMTGEDGIKNADGFHASGAREDVPEYAKNAVFLKEHTIPASPFSTTGVKEKIDVDVLHHEFGHVTQDGLLQSELYQDWNPQFKANAPDKEYVGALNETDTRIRSMYRTLGDTFNPEKEVFGKKQLEILRDKLAKGQLDKDTKDLLEHYDDITLVKLANRLPAI